MPGIRRRSGGLEALLGLDTAPLRREAVEMVQTEVPDVHGDSPLEQSRSLPSRLGIKAVREILLRAVGSPVPHLAEVDGGFSANLPERTQLGFEETVHTVKERASCADTTVTNRNEENRVLAATARRE